MPSVTITLDRGESSDPDYAYVVDDTGEEWNEAEYFAELVDAEGACEERADHYRELGFNVAVKNTAS